VPRGSVNFHFMSLAVRFGHESPSATRVGTKIRFDPKMRMVVVCQGDLRIHDKHKRRMDALRRFPLVVKRSSQIGQKYLA
jgi:hypothetical protein